MKKIITCILAFAIVAMMSMTAFAVEIDQDSVRNTADAVITTKIEPSYTVTIPADIQVPFRAKETEFGAISIESARIHPDKCIKVMLNASGFLKNETDASKVIPYVVKSGEEIFSSATYLAAGDKTMLTIHIKEEAWNKAFAGSYKDTVTFTVSYEDKEIP